MASRVVTEEMLSTTAFQWLRELTERSKRSSGVASKPERPKAESLSRDAIQKRRILIFRKGELSALRFIGTGSDKAGFRTTRDDRRMQ